MPDDPPTEPHFRIPGFIANPVVTIVLAGLLLLDAASLPTHPYRGGISTCGRVLQDLRRFASGGPSAVVEVFPPEAVILREGDRMRLLNMGTEPSWGDAAQVLQENPPNGAILSGPGPSIGRGFWAITRFERRFEVSGRFGSAFTDTDKRMARDLFVAEVLEPVWDDSPRYLQRVRREDFTVTTTVWSGYLHNLLALTGFGVLLVSLAWIPRTPGYVRRWRARRNRRGGGCPRCGYPLEGLTTCPECGAAA